ncbi:DUF3025 domain-containing protein [Aliiglaciecola litoralis]|uniref:DUF3025 domain-containing protein n=1 Tax=Aliiglaciecola litoralis TaxID=582857 RepID=A0ABP3WZG7_9ALTE
MNSNGSTLKAKTQASEIWACRRDLPPFTELEQMFRLSEFDNILNADTLNLLKNKVNPDCHFDFVCQSDLGEIELYYEDVIFTHSQIPTRANSWHDLFNGLIWLQFPKTKALLNRWHMEDIQLHGLTPRTQRRNQITHFDECGVIVVCDEQARVDALREHQFKSILFEKRQRWDKDIQAMVFGHANYEMLLQPYIGLTGKWLHIKPCNGYFEMSKLQQLQYIDKVLCQQLIDNGAFCNSCRLSPLPLLGIPGWWPENEQSQFYDNVDYFRPKPNKKTKILKSQLSVCREQIE